MNPLWLLTKKNLKLLIRSKGSALIVVFAPLLIILLLGLSFNNSAKYGLKIGVYAPVYNNDVNSFINTLQEQEFKIIKYNESKQECIEDVKSEFIHTCISLPESFAIEGNSQKEIIFYVDPSKINLVWMIQQTIEEKLNLKSQEISQVLAQDLLTRINDASTKIATENGQLSAVKQKNSNAAASAETARSGLSKIDLVPPAAAYDINVVTNFKEAISSSVTLGTTKIAAAKSSLNSANISSSARSAVISLLNEANAGLTNATTMITATSGNASFGAVNELITTMQNDVNSAKSKLTAASQQVSTTNANLEQVKATLNDGLSSLENIQKELEQVNANLNAKKVSDAKIVSTPLITKIEKVSPENTYLNYMFPALIILVIMFSSLLLGTTLVMMEKHSPAFTRNFFLPIKKVTFVLSTYLTNLILILIQVVIILGISLVFLTPLYSIIPQIALILFLSASVFTFLGMAIGYLFNSEETAVLASISLGSILLFVSGLILPLESVSPMVRDITYFNPFVISEKLVRELFIFNSPMSAIWLDLVTLVSYALILFLVILILESLLHKQIVNKFFHHHHQLQKQKQKMEKHDV